MLVTHLDAIQTNLKKLFHEIYPEEKTSVEKIERDKMKFWQNTEKNIKI